MKHFLAALLLSSLTAAAFAQDKVRLTNGDTLTGTVKTMADGKLTVASAPLGDVSVPLDQVVDLVTADTVELLTKNGERLRRRITGLADGKLALAGGEGGPAIPELALAELSQINPPAEPPATWTGSMKLNAGLTTGNTERRQVGASFEAIRRTSIDRITADAAWDYAEDKTLGDWNLTQRRVGAGLKYDYFLSKRWYALATTRALGDTLADLSLRYTVGAGMGYQWVETDDVEFLTEAGLSYFNENYRSATPSQDYLSARAAYRLRYAFSPTSRLLHGTEAFPSVERGEDVYFTMTTELQNNLTGNMITSLAWIWDYDNTPAPGRDRSDHRLVLSVGWTF